MRAAHLVSVVAVCTNEKGIVGSRVGVRTTRLECRSAQAR